MAVTLKVAFVPAHWAKLAGCAVMAGAVFTTRVAALEVCRSAGSGNHHVIIASTGGSNIVQCIGRIGSTGNVYPVFPPLVGESCSGCRYRKGDVGAGALCNPAGCPVMAVAVFTVRAAFEVDCSAGTVITTL